MDIPYLLVILALGTMAAVIIFALVSKAQTEARMKDDNAPKSRLAKDAPNK